MKYTMNQIGTFVSEVAKTAKVRKRLLAVVVVFIILQLYFVRELIAAELLFGLGFAVLFFLATLFYVVGAIGERAIDATKVGAHAVADSAHRGFVKASPVLDVAAKRSALLAEASVRVLARSASRGYAAVSPVLENGAKALAQSARGGYRKLEEISKKPFRHPRSESAR